MAVVQATPRRRRARGVPALWITGAAGALFVVVCSFFAWRNETGSQA